ncbi:hypothetical protein SAMN02910456_01859 [Ruminococcaceae bacterium YRB3002]|nr:hypothetical protein SAMN02910456_01859 [Ruminococcaceae bacterium YRB3002]
MANKDCAYTADEMNAVSIPLAYSGYNYSLRSGVVFAGASLSFKTETTLSLYFSSDKTLEFSCDDTKNVETATVKTDAGTRYQVVRIRGVKAKELCSTITVNIEIDGASGYGVSFFCLIQT